MEYKIHTATHQDAPDIAMLYNANPNFLHTHLGLAAVTQAFVRREMDEMQRLGFCTVLFTGESGASIGFCDYKEQNGVYLSLFLVDGTRQGAGLGGTLYALLEQQWRTKGVPFVRLEAVDTYAGNAVGFWKKQGFSFTERTTLVWNEKSLQAQRMVKQL